MAPVGVFPAKGMAVAMLGGRTSTAPQQPHACHELYIFERYFKLWESYFKAMHVSILKTLLGFSTLLAGEARPMHAASSPPRASSP